MKMKGMGPGADCFDRVVAASVDDLNFPIDQTAEVSVQSDLQSLILTQPVQSVWPSPIATEPEGVGLRVRPSF